MAEGDRGRIAAVLAADADLQLRAHLAAALDADAHQFTDALLVDRHERIGRQDPARGINAEEARGVVARNAERRLRQIVSAEREELRRLGDLAGHQTGARQFDHGADVVIELGAGFLVTALRHGVDARLDQIELGAGGDQRHHHFRPTGLPVRFPTSTAASKMARACISAISG